MTFDKLEKPQPSRSKNSVLNLITGFGGQFFAIILNFITRTVFVATLGKEYLGINGLFSDILTMLSLTEFGLDTAINFKLYKPIAEGDKKRVRILMKFYRDAYRVVGVVITVLGICLIPALPILIKDYNTLAELNINATFIFLIYLLQCVSSYLFFASYAAIVKADQHEYLLNISRYAVLLLSFVSQMLILLFRKSFIEYTISLVFFTVLQNLINAVIAKRRYPWAFETTTERIKISEIKDIFKDLGALFIFKVNSVVVKATDNIVLSAFIGLSIVGTYSNYLMIFNALLSLLARFYNAISASMGNLFALADSKRKYQFFESMNMVTMILYGTTCVGIAVTANELIGTWLGSDYVLLQPFPILIGIELLFAGIRNNLNGFRNATGVFRKMWWRPLLGIVVNIIVSICLVYPLGIYGVIIGTISADFFTVYLIEPKVIHKYCLDDYRPTVAYYKKNLKYMGLILLAGGVDWFLCSNLLTGYGWLSFIAHVCFCAVSVPLVFYLFCKKQHEMKYVMSLLGGLVSRFAQSQRNKRN